MTIWIYLTTTQSISTQLFDLKYLLEKKQQSDIMTAVFVCTRLWQKVSCGHDTTDDASTWQPSSDFESNGSQAPLQRQVNDNLFTGRTQSRVPRSRVICQAEHRLAHTPRFCSCHEMVKQTWHSWFVFSPVWTSDSLTAGEGADAHLEINSGAISQLLGF